MTCRVVGQLEKAELVAEVQVGLLRMDLNSLMSRTTLTSSSKAVEKETAASED